MAYRAISGKLAGLGADRSDPAYLAYLAAHQQWVTARNAQSAVVARNSARETAYYQAAGIYQQQKQAYNAALDARYALIQQRAVAARNQAAAVAQRFGLTINPSFSGCVTQTEHDQALAQCKSVNDYQSVKGLGASPTGWPPCAIAQLAVCQPDPPMPRSPGLPPLRSASERIPAIGPEPQPPGLLSVTASAPYPPIPVLNQGPPASSLTPPITTTTPSSTPPATAVMHQAGLAKAGLVLLVVAGGGFVLYRTFRKQKASA